MEKRNRDAFGIFCVVLCQSLFGFSFLFSKIGTNISDPISLLAWRFTIAFLVMTLFIKTGFVRVDIKTKNIKTLIVLAVFTPVLNYLLETIGISMSTSSESGVMVASLPIWCMITSSVLLRKPPTMRQVTGILLTIIGVLMCIFANGFVVSFHMLGNIIIVISVFSNSIYAALSEKAAEFTSTEKTYVMLLLGAAAFMTMAVIRNGTAGELGEFILLPVTNRMYLLAVLYLGVICSLAAFMLNNTALSIIGTTRASSFGGISTVVSVLAGVILLNEKFAIPQVIGTALVIFGAYIANTNLLRSIFPKSERR